MRDPEQIDAIIAGLAQLAWNLPPELAAFDAFAGLVQVRGARRARGALPEGGGRGALPDDLVAGTSRAARSRRTSHRRPSTPSTT